MTASRESAFGWSLPDTLSDLLSSIKITLDGALVHGGSPLDHGKIGLFHRRPRSLQLALDGLALGEQHQPRGFPVEPMHDPRPLSPPRITAAQEFVEPRMQRVGMLAVGGDG